MLSLRRMLANTLLLAAGLICVPATIAQETLTVDRPQDALVVGPDQGTLMLRGARLRDFQVVALNDIPAGENEDVAVGDLNGDGILDAFVARLRAPNLLLLGTDGGGFLASEVGTPARSTAVALADFDDDGDLDAFVANEGKRRAELEDLELRSMLYVNDGTTAFEVVPAYSEGLNPEDVVVDDFTGDGFADAIVPDAYEVHLLFVGAGNGSFGVV